ncbi:MAG: CotH kinase family protein [Bacilli bacterium]|nr:CotH kinase family protein [Bacilli bacterium]
MNKDKRNNIKLLGTLNNADESGIIANANQIYDANENKSTQDVSKEHTERIKILETKENSMQTTLENITKTGEASAASNVTYNHSDSNLDATNVQQAIDEVVTKKISKENIAQELGNAKDKVISQFALPFREIESPEFIKAIVDAEDHFLFGIHLDGSIEWSKGIPAPIKTKLHEIINQCQNDKTDILEAINTAKENLYVSIAALREGKVDKEEGKSLIEDEVKECFRVIENEEFIKAIVDSDDKVLFGFYRATGKPYYPLNEMYHVIQNEEYFAAWVTTDDKVVLGIRRDGQIIGEIHAVNALKETIKEIQKDIQDDISSLHDEVGTIDTNLKELIDVFSLQENPEYMAVETDEEGKVLSATYNDGSHYIHNVKSETIPTEFEHIEDPEERMEITTDTEGKVMSYRDANGKKHEHSMEINNLDVSNLNLQGNSVNNIQDALKANGFDVKTPIDWSDKDSLEIPEPRCAYINITSSDGTAATWPTTKTANKKYWMQFWDMQGNYFKKRIILNAQGSSSMAFIKKNGAIDICNDEWIGDDTFKVKFGDWLAFDSFHLKAYYTDFFKGVSVMAYKLADEVEISRDVLVNRPWKRQLLAKYTFGTDQTNSAQVNDLSLQLDNEAKCHPDAFPCIVYLDNEFYGIYAFSIKKHRDNYHLDKGTAENIHLDGNLDGYDIWNGTINWSSFEIRNPKNLYYKEAHNGSYEYDADVAQAEIAGDNEVNTWIAAGQLPDGTKISSKIEKRLKITAKVKNYIIRVSKALAAINTETDTARKKTLFESYFDALSLIDYEIVQMATGDTDGLSKNWQWITLDGNHWSVCEYDKDMSFGGYFTGEFTQAAPSQGGWMGNNSRTPLGLTISLYKDDIVSMWKKLTNNNVITADNIISIADDWIKRIGTDNYKKEYKKWNEAPCCRADLVDTKHWKRSNEYKYGTEYNTYNSTKTYAVGDTCYYGFDNVYKFTAIAETTGNPPITGNYNYKPKGLGYYDSFWRLANYIKQRISVENDFINSL